MDQSARRSFLNLPPELQEKVFVEYHPPPNFTLNPGEDYSRHFMTFLKLRRNQTGKDPALEVTSPLVDKPLESHGTEASGDVLQAINSIGQQIQGMATKDDIQMISKRVQDLEGYISVQRRQTFLAARPD